MKKRYYNLLILFLFFLGIATILTIMWVIKKDNKIIKEPVKTIVEIIDNEEPKEEEIVYLKSPEQEYLEKLEELDKIKNNKEWYIAYKKLNNEYKNIGEIESIDDVLNEEDLYYLQRVVETECFGADFDSKVHVASVVLNRVEDERFPETVKEVVTQKNQFCFFRKDITDDTKLACEYAFQISNEADNCLWFHSMKKTDEFSGGKYLFTDSCGHNFFY